MKFNGEVTDELLEGIISYCKDNLIADGWMGHFHITPSTRNELIANNPKFKEIMELIPYISRDTINCLTRNISIGLAKKGIVKDDMDKIKLSTALLSKQMEFIYKMEKDTGIFKDEADSRRKRKSYSSEKIGLTEVENLMNLMES